MLGDEPSLDALMGCLERRGAREGALHGSLAHNRDAIAAGMPAGTLRCARGAAVHFAIVPPSHTPDIISQAMLLVPWARHQSAWPGYSTSGAWQM